RTAPDPGRTHQSSVGDQQEAPRSSRGVCPMSQTGFVPPASSPYSPPAISCRSIVGMAEFPSKAKVVIIGLGGIVGASIAHHLVERGWDDIVGIDKSGIPTDIGSTAHASDFCY